MNKLEKFIPSLVTEAYFPKEVSNPQEINYGRCFMWSYLAHQTFCGIELWCMGTHAFVKHRGKFYDSETLQGSPDWQDLRANNVNVWARQPIHKHLRRPFIKEWDTQPVRFNTSWNEMNQWAINFLRKGSAEII